MSLVSVIIPTFNRKDTIIRAVSSVLSQNYDELECIVVDDASTDETLEVLSRIQDSRLSIVSLKENKGVSAARNIGFDNSSGDFIALLDSDDEWHKDKLSKQVPLLKKYSLVHGEEIWVRNGKKINQKKIHQKSGGKVKITGLGNHISSTNHKLATKIKIDVTEPLTRRQNMLKEWAENYGWDFQAEPVKDLDYFQSFYFFKSRVVEAESNCISDQDNEFEVELIDVQFEEGTDIFPDEYKTTVGLMKLPFSIPKFTIEKRDFLDKVLPISEHRDIDYILYNNVPRGYIAKVENSDEMDAFMTDKLKVLIEISGLHHLESNGEAILIFSNNFSLAQVRDYIKMIQFVENFKSMINEER